MTDEKTVEAPVAQDECAGDTPKSQAETGRESLKELFDTAPFTEQKYLWKAMRHARRIGRKAALYRAFIAAIPNLPTLEKNRQVDFMSKRTNQQVNYWFADLEEILGKVVPVIQAHGLGIYFKLAGNKVKGRLIHDDGGQLKSWLTVKDHDDGASLQTEISKRRRYILLALLNLAASEGGTEGNRDRQRSSRGRNDNRSHRPDNRASGAGRTAQGAGSGQQGRPGQGQPGKRTPAQRQAGSAEKSSATEDPGTEQRTGNRKRTEKACRSRPGATPGNACAGWRSTTRRAAEREPNAGAGGYDEATATKARRRTRETSGAERRRAASQRRRPGDAVDVREHPNR